MMQSFGSSTQIRVKLTMFVVIPALVIACACVLHKQCHREQIREGEQLQLTANARVAHNEVPQHQVELGSPSSRLIGGAAAPCTPTVNRTRAAATMDFIIVNQSKSHKWVIASESTKRIRQTLVIGSVLLH
eukprot:20867-Heterococcus_DN1.PRE.2